MNIPYVFKRCTKCGEIKLATTEYFSKAKRGKFGLESQCKVCKQEYSKQWRRDNKEHCQEYCKQWRQDNKEHFQEYHKEYCKQWYQDNKEHKLEYCKQWYQDNKEHYQEYNKEYYKEYSKTPQGQVAYFNACQRRRTKEAALGNGITKEQWLECMNFFGWKCAYSGESLSNKKARSLDHITPLNSGGDNEIWNLVPMYRNYNSSKKDKEMVEWYKEQPFYSEDRLKKIYEWQEYAYNKYYEEVAYCTK